MSFLLGNETCIESLQSDLRDIQDTIDDIIVRLSGCNGGGGGCGGGGAAATTTSGNNNSVKCYYYYYSWKYPDRNACDLKINDLLDRYKYGKDEVDNQVTHLSLLELIIDRFLLLINLSTNQLDTCLITNDTRPPSTGSATIRNKKGSNRLSVGLTVKKYWSKMIHLCTLNRQLKSTVNAINNNNNNNNNNHRSYTHSQNTLVSIINSNNKKETLNEISLEQSCKCTQTQETSFVPCVACAQLQAHLKEQGDLIFQICHFQNLSCNLSKYRSSLGTHLEAGWLNASDIERWMIEEDKDLNKIFKQFEYLTQNNNLLKSKLNELEINLNKVKNVEKELRLKLKEEKDTLSIQMRQYERKLSEQRAEYEMRVKQVEDDLFNLNCLKDNFQLQIKSLEDINKKNELLIQELNESNRVLNQDLNEKLIQTKQIEVLEREQIGLKKELDCVRRDLVEKTKDLNKERMKIDNLIRQEQSLLLKQESLIKRIEQLSNENETLRNECESVRQELLLIKENDTTHTQSIEIIIQELQTKINLLNKEIQESKEKELLLIQYPDLYGPIEIKKEMSLIEDMQLQIQANVHRINLLELQNKSLNKSIDKLKQVELKNNNNNNDLKDNYVQDEIYVKRPVPLFKLEHEISLLDEQQHEQQEYNNNYKKKEYKDNVPMLITNAFEMINNKDTKVKQLKNNDETHYACDSSETPSLSSPPPPPSISTVKSPCYQHKRELLNNHLQSPSTCKDFEVVIGKGHRPSTTSRNTNTIQAATASAATTTTTTSARSNSASSRHLHSKDIAFNNTLSKKYICDKCNNKMYTLKKDLDIHKIYCNNR